MAEKLTPAQSMAVHNRGGKLLVSAAAGSGKTKVLVDRLMDYLMSPLNPAHLDEFLIITYTKAAAMELRGKIAAGLNRCIAQNPENKHLQRQMQRLFLTQISTVHGFCSTILREYAYRVDLPPDFRVAEEAECADLREAVLRDLMERAYENGCEGNHFREFVDSQGVGRDDRAIPDIILKVYSAARCHQDPQKWLDDCLDNVKLDGVTDAADTIWGKSLMDSLFDWLDVQIGVQRELLRRLERDEGVEKPIANIGALVQQLEYLRDSKTWDDVYTRKNIDFGKLTFSGKKYDPVLAEQVKAVRNACKAELESRTRCFADDSGQVIADLRASTEAAQGIVELVRRFAADYAALKRRRRILDFGDLEHDTLDLLLGKSRTGPTAAAVEIGSRFREIMVDEYQDSNGVQDAIFEALTRAKQNCFMVGDVKQSIYRFRLADPRIFLKKYTDYALAENAKLGEGRKILLSHNFRSGIEVISGINDVFETCMSKQVGGLAYGEAEALREGVPHVPLDSAATELYVLDVADGDSYEKEAAFTAKRICTMLSAGETVRNGAQLRPVTPEDIVILLRSPGSMAAPFCDALEAAGIHCALDGSSSLMDTPEVSTFCALLQAVANPRLDIPLLSILASPVFGFTADDLASFRGDCKKGSIYDAMKQSQNEKVQYFLSVLDVLRKKSRMENLTQLLQSCLTLTRLDSIFGAMSGAEARQQNLQTFYQMAVDYESSSLRTLDQFLEYLQTMADSRVETGGSSAGCVRIMSIHKSKGLEFPVVFLCGLSHRFNPSDRQEQVLCDKNLGLGLAVADNQNRIRYSAISKLAIADSIKRESISEELRVLYVAMTRAEDRLIMTCTMKNPQKRLTDMANRLIAGGEALVCMEADCHGDWILATALRRIEAGALHALAGRPEQLHTDDYPWHIELVEAEETLPQGEHTVLEESTFPPEAVASLQKGLQFSYAHLPATHAPSKQTATGRKGSAREEEAMEDTRKMPDNRTWRKPSFRENARRGKAYGNAVHRVMQFIRYEGCTDASSVQMEIQRLLADGILSQEEAAMVSPDAIASFFATDIGRRLQGGAEYIREFKFSILDDGEKYGDGLEGEQVLLQGVVDCAILEEDGITVLDFKTDRVTEENVAATINRYRPQLETYAEALSRIYEKNVKEKYLYFFHLGELIGL